MGEGVLVDMHINGFSLCRQHFIGAASSMPCSKRQRQRRLQAVFPSLMSAEVSSYDMLLAAATAISPSLRQTSCP